MIRRRAACASCVMESASSRMMTRKRAFELARASTILTLGNTSVVFLYALHVAAANEWRTLHVIATVLRLGIVPATALALSCAARGRPHALHVAATNKWLALHVIATIL